MSTSVTKIVVRESVCVLILVFCGLKPEEGQTSQGGPPVGAAVVIMVCNIFIVPISFFSSSQLLLLFPCKLCFSESSSLVASACGPELHGWSICPASIFEDQLVSNHKWIKWRLELTVAGRNEPSSLQNSRPQTNPSVSKSSTERLQFWIVSSVL